MVKDAGLRLAGSPLLAMPYILTIQQIMMKFNGESVEQRCDSFGNTARQKSVANLHIISQFSLVTKYQLHGKLHTYVPLWTVLIYQK